MLCSNNACFGVRFAAGSRWRRLYKTFQALYERRQPPVTFATAASADSNIRDSQMHNERSYAWTARCLQRIDR